MEHQYNIDLIPAAEADLDEICALCHSIAVHTPASLWDDHYPARGMLAHDLAVRSLYKVMEEGRIISIMQIRPMADFLAGSEEHDIPWDKTMANPCALGRFCVAPDKQGRGLGREIMAATLEKAGSMGYDGAVFHAVKSNDAATHIYDTMGFHRVGEIFEYGIDFICYEMKL